MLASGQARDNRHLLNLLLDRDFGLCNNLLSDALTRHPRAMKASAAPDPDSPRLHEAVGGEHREEFLVAMSKQIEELESRGTWTVIKKSSLPRTKPDSAVEATSRSQVLISSKATFQLLPGLPFEWL